MTALNIKKKKVMDLKTISHLKTTSLTASILTARKSNQ